MSQPRNDLSKYDATERELTTLDSALRSKAAANKPYVPRESVEEAKRGESQFEVISDRDTIRLLFISRDEALLNQTNQSLDGYLNLSEVFDEVHIVILRPGIPAKNPVLRVAPNVWLYIATSNYSFTTPLSALKLIREQLEFADGFRADLIVARDPYESALAAYLIGRRYGRAVQLHVLEDFTNPAVTRFLPSSWWRVRLAKFLIHRFLSVRTATNQLKVMINSHFKDIPDVEVLPRLNNYESYTHAPVVRSLKDKYPQFSFIILYFGPLSHTSTVYQVIDAAREVLRNARVGLVIVGDGKARSEFQKRTELFGISTHVVFEKTAEDMAGYLKTADVLMVSDTDSVGDEVVLRGAAVGIPLIITETALRSDLFVHQQSALMVKAGDTEAMARQLSFFLNNFSIRSGLAKQALAVVATKLHEDPRIYRQAYRTSVEQGLFAGEIHTVTEPESSPSN